MNTNGPSNLEISKLISSIETAETLLKDARQNLETRVSHYMASPTDFGMEDGAAALRKYKEAYETHKAARQAFTDSIHYWLKAQNANEAK